MMIHLVKLTVNLKESYFDYYSEWEMAGEKMNPGILRKTNPYSFEELVKTQREIEYANNITNGIVPETVFFLVNETNRILGAVTIRHSLSERMLQTEGHIGAGIRPSERQKGYGVKILALSLDIMREMGFQKALVTCNADNIASEKAIIKNGGVRDNDYLETHGNTVKRFWITL